MNQKIKSLKCKKCVKKFPAKTIYVCEFCFGALEVNYDYGRIKRKIIRKTIEQGPLSLRRYRELLPVESDNITTLQEGFTPLISAKNLGEILSIENLYTKNDTVNPIFRSMTALSR